LEKKGFIETEKKGISKYVFPSETKHSTLFKTLLMEFTHIKFENFLSESSLDVLYSTSGSPLSRKEIMLWTGLSEKTIQTRLKTLRQFGIVITKRGLYTLNERFGLLRDFLLEFRRYLNLKIAQQFAWDAVILWQEADEFLIKTSERKESKNFFLTSITAFHRYGVQLFLPEYYYYFHSKRRKKLTLEDIILHALILDPTDTRVIMSVLLLWKKQKMNVDRLVKKSEKYRLRSNVEDMVEYVRTRGKVRPDNFPMWKEYEVKAKEYRM
jgi:biotin operon repressor